MSPARPDICRGRDRPSGDVTAAFAPHVIGPLDPADILYRRQQPIASVRLRIKVLRLRQLSMILLLFHRRQSGCSSGQPLKRYPPELTQGDDTSDRHLQPTVQNCAHNISLIKR